MDSLKKILRSCFTRRSDHSAPPASPPSSPLVAAAGDWQEPTEPYPVPQYLYITTSAEANYHLQTIQAGAVIGLDTEAVQQSRPKLSKAEKKAKLAAEIRDRASFVIDWSDVDTCLVQIATEEGHVFVINLHIMAGGPSSSLVILNL
ncbi:hypothetical protein K438DRAFT_1998449 [Mycena galopus ATCC 62051]|nr:hypothetical protein K438DRAFT_1998449 [Mycena galopus ATCC 62051]